MRSPPKRPPTTAFHQRRRGLVRSALLVVGGVIFVNALVGERGLLENMRRTQQLTQVQQRVVGVRAENERLRVEADRLEHDLATVEQRAREELGLIRPGETLFIIRDRDRDRARSVRQPDTETAPLD